MKTEYNDCLIDIARFCFRLQTEQKNVHFFLPDCYDKFDVSSQKNEAQLNLSITIHHDRQPPDLSSYPIISLTDIWELRRTNQGGLIFSTKKNRYSKTLIIDKDFEKADLFGQFKTIDGVLQYPLDNLDMLTTVNWLALRSDLALHASGVIINGKGYAFLGKSGAGKSTMAASLASQHQAQVLGEDSVVLRYINDQFYIFGTPWHENLEMCSPEGIPLTALFLLDREADFGLQRISTSEGVARIMQTAFVPYYRPELMPSMIDNLAKLTLQTPFYRLNYLLGEDVYLVFLKDLHKFDR